MYLQHLKSKYKQILHPTCSDENAQNFKSIHQTKKSGFRALTEYSENTSKPHVPSSSAYVLALKEKIAQMTHNLTQKEHQLNILKEELMKKNQSINMLELKLEESRKAAELSEEKVVQAKVVSATLENNITKLKSQIEAFSMDRQLALKQSQYYKSEASKISKQKKSQNRFLDTCQKNLKEVEAIKQENSRLREDIKRLNTIINEMCQQRLNTDVTDKHYLGKPLKEASMWFSQNLVGEVEHFLKKEQMAQGNKKFFNNLVKFICKYTNAVSKSKSSSNQNSRIKSLGKSSHIRCSSVCDPCYSSIQDLGTELIKRNNCSATNSLKKSLMMNKYKKIDSRKYTPESFLITEKDSGTSICEQILNEYKGVLREALKEKQIKAKIILDLSDQMSDAVIQLFNGYIS